MTGRDRVRPVTTRTELQEQRLVRGRRRARIAGIVIAVLAFDVAAYCAWKADADDRERRLGPSSCGGVAYAKEFEPLREALMRRGTSLHGFPRRADELLGRDELRTPWISDAAALDDEFGRRVDLRVENTRLGECCTAWSLGRDGRRGGGDDVCLVSVELSFGEVQIVPLPR